MLVNELHFAGAEVYSEQELLQVAAFVPGSTLTLEQLQAMAARITARYRKDGYFVALDAKAGKLLWKAALGGQVNAGAMTYAVHGRQYIAIAAGTALFVFSLP